MHTCMQHKRNKNTADNNAQKVYLRIYSVEDYLRQDTRRHVHNVPGSAKAHSSRHDVHNNASIVFVAPK